ncbi:MAG: ABC transporter six-transmembrane domain-containing protein [Paracoccus sp. (in: a-proteobacteria)]|uniref:ABC transporter six-transmembrane domain-containing protein n=1 Tax=Paracoccus sp. TaxID=267 RepID=UPI0026E0F8F0|nr:ABC transporter six-transmembrane domain-containing protein [Paracoccus sp. (in: a-proteobacteria)]MDO5620093.1 ABC transporter six-transmembrane domain-containing protein [Paracoccus sp. (in: a-proteobacteria)]
MPLNLQDRLSVARLFRVFWWQIMVTWLLVLVETGLFALMPLLIGWSIDGLIKDDWTAFRHLVLMLLGLMVVATLRRVYDTRVYGTIRVELGKVQAARSATAPVSVRNARVLMGRELVDFLENTAPEAMTALVQVFVAVVVLLSFHGLLAISSVSALALMLLIYAVAAPRFFRLNGALNEASEGQVSALESHSPRRIAAHFLRLRKQEVRLSDTESIVYGLIFSVLLGMLAYNIWFAATKLGGSPGTIFSVVSYSQEFLQSAVQLPIALQALTRLREISERISGTV